MAITVRLLLPIFLAYLHALSVLAEPSSSNDTTLFFSLMVSSAPALDTTGVLSAVDQVLEFINNESEILPGYRLQYANVLDTQVCQSIGHSKFM